jgi:hypothetical protein
MISFNTVNPPIPESKMPIDFSKTFHPSSKEQWWPTMIFQRPIVGDNAALVKVFPVPL